MSSSDLHSLHHRPPFSSFGSFKQRKGHPLSTDPSFLLPRSAEAPGKLESFSHSPADLQRELAWERKIKLHEEAAAKIKLRQKEEEETEKEATLATEYATSSKKVEECMSSDYDEFDEDDEDECESSSSSDGSCSDKDGSCSVIDSINGTRHNTNKDDFKRHENGINVPETESFHNVTVFADSANIGNESEKNYKEKILNRLKSKSFSKSRDGTNRKMDRVKSRTWTFTDEDMEELRGSIELGFGFSGEEACLLKETLPALELYYAISHQKSSANEKINSTGTSWPSASSTSVSSTTSSPLIVPAYPRISRPGDKPRDVKQKLKKWAKLVACYMKEGSVP